MAPVRSNALFAREFGRAHPHAPDEKGKKNERNGNGPDDRLVPLADLLDALIGIAAANQATKKAAATANGLTGLFGYASTLVSGVGLGFVAQHYGWNWAYVGILGMAVVGMLVFLLMWGAKADGYEPEAE